MADPGVRAIPPMPLPKTPGIKSRMDMAEAGGIAREPVEELVVRYEKLSARFSGQRSAVSSRSGPSDETRKKLREKRKRKKQGIVYKI